MPICDFCTKICPYSSTILHTCLVWLVYLLHEQDRTSRESFSFNPKSITASWEDSFKELIHRSINSKTDTYQCVKPVFEIIFRFSTSCLFRRFSAPKSWSKADFCALSAGDLTLYCHSVTFSGHHVFIKQSSLRRELTVCNSNSTHLCRCFAASERSPTRFDIRIVCGSTLMTLVGSKMMHAHLPDSIDCARWFR